MFKKLNDFNYDVHKNISDNKYLKSDSFFWISLIFFFVLQYFVAVIRGMGGELLLKKVFFGILSIFTIYISYITIMLWKLDDNNKLFVKILVLSVLMLLISLYGILTFS